MLDHRVYRAAFLPAVVVLLLAAFTLGDRPAPSTTRVAPDAFGADRALATLRELAEAFPDRSAGSPGDLGVAARVRRELQASGFAGAGDVRSFDVEATGGPLRVVMAERLGLSSRRIVVLADREAPAGGPETTLSGTAVLIELARVLADRDLQATVVLASVSGASSGYAATREAIRRVDGPVDAVLVLGDLASERVRRPFVVPWSLDGAPAPAGLRRTVEAALRAETGADPGGTRASAQWARRVAPITVSEQGVANAEGVPAVLLSATGELGPRAGDEVSVNRLRAFGRTVLRSFTAIEGARPARGSDERAAAFESADGIVTVGRLVPGWAVRLVILALLAPALLAAVDAFFRVRRRGLPAGRWLLWAASFGLPFLLAWLWLRLLDLVGGVDALPAPAPPGAVELGTGPAVALGSAVLVVALGFVGARRLLVQRAGPRGEVAAGGAAAAVGLLIALLTFAVWIVNPYAAGVLLVAAHAWLLVPAPESAVRGPLAVLAVLAGLVAPALVAVYFLVALELSGQEALRLVFDLVAGGEVGLFDAVALSLVAGSLLAALAVLFARRRAARSAPPETVRTRGPRSYAGPGSLGGTDSALRR